MDSFVSPVCLPWNSNDPGHNVITGDKTTVTGKVILYESPDDRFLMKHNFLAWVKINRPVGQFRVHKFLGVAFSL